MNDSLNVLVYLRESNERYRGRLRNSGDVSYAFCNSEEEVRRSIGSARIILGSIAFPSHLLPLARHLRWIQVTGAGVDAFLARCELPEGVLLTRADVAFGDQIAEYVLGHLLTLTQKLRDVMRLQQERTWQPLQVEFLAGKTMGIIGTGSIGQAVAARARGMGMRTIGVARTPRDIPGLDHVYSPDELARFLPQLDVLVLCAPLTAETRGMLGREQIAHMKASSILVNVARGAIVDEPALIDALQRHSIRAAILDVFEREPLSAESPLWTMDHVTVTSHHSGLNIPDDVIDFFLENLRRFQSGARLNGVVDVTLGY
jgi:phosphoglycerate dehydrogenase-like enzyme